MKHYLALHVFHQRIRKYKQFSIENFVLRVRRAKVTANSFQEMFTNNFLSTIKTVA